MERRPIAILLERSIAALDRVIEITETSLRELRQAKKKLQEELSQLTPVQAREAFRKASQELQKVNDDEGKDK